MRRWHLPLLAAVAASAVAVAAATDPKPRSLDYDVVGLKGKLWLEVEAEPLRLAVGDRAVSGDRLRTGSSSQAQLDVASHATHFLLAPKTRCTLAHGRPGVLLHVERGRLRAIFDAITGDEPRLVTTPSAVLAVRGTEYGLQVAKNGSTHVVVFAGVVDVTDPAGTRPPVRVHAGQQTRVASGRPPDAPSPHRVTTRDWDRGRTAQPPGAAGSGFDRGAPAGGLGSAGAGGNPGQSGSKRHGG